jgi:hypothetical protein
MTNPDLQHRDTFRLIIEIICDIGIILPLLVFTWAALGLYTSFFLGRIPLIQWYTPHKIIFGFIWLFFIFPGITCQARIVQNCFRSIAIWCYGWSLLPLAFINMCFQICGIIAIPTSWFPSPFPPPLAHVKGGIIIGLFTLVLAILILLPCNLILFRYMKWIFRNPPS